MTLMVVLGAALGFGIALAQPNTYESAGALLVRLGEEERAATRDLITAPNYGGAPGPTSQDVNSEVAILDSADTFGKVLERIDPSVILEPYDPTKFDDEFTPRWVRWLHDVQRWIGERDHRALQERHGSTDEGMRRVAVETLQENTTIRAEPYTNSIEIGYETHDPKLAQSVVQAILDSCLERHNEVFSSQPRLEALTVAYESASVEWSEARKALSDYRLQTGIIDAALERQALITRRGQLEAARSEIVRQLSGLADSLRFVDETRTGLPAEIPAMGPPQRVINPEWTILTTRLREQETRLDELLDDYAESTVEVQVQRARVATTRSELVDCDQLVVADGVPYQVPNPRLEELAAHRTDLEEDRTKFQAESTAVEHELEDIVTRLELIEAAVPELARLTSDERVKDEQQQALYAQLESVRRKARVLDEKGRSNLLVSRRASFDPEKVGPRRLKSIVFGALAGFLIGAALAFVRWQIDRTYHHPAQIERDLEIPVICVIDDDAAWAKVMRS
ncbi:MAG: hypothetical protein KDC38_15395 [Planctomycetes bacterium]|nr:hypothetical protein [Planctomycetota bacterium]